MTDTTNEKATVAAPAAAVADTALVAPTSAERREGFEAYKARAEKDRLAEAKPAKIAPADAADIRGSGAIVEPGAMKAVDVDHPAVDNNPRAGTTVKQNQIDFNDPTLLDHEAVEENLRNA